MYLRHLLLLLLLFPLLLRGGNTDSLQRELQLHIERKDYQAQINNYLALGAAYKGRYQHKEALAAFEAGLVVATRERDILHQFEFLNAAGLMNFWLDNYTTSLEQLLKAREIGVGVVTEKDQVENLSLISDVYISLGNYKQALYHQLQALEMAELISDSVGMASSFRNLGTIYWYREQYDLSLENLQRSLTLYKEKDKEGVVVCTILAAISSNYASKKQPDQGLKYANEALELARKIDYSYGVAFSTGMLGVLYKDKQNYPEALSYARNAIDQMRQLDIKAERIEFQVLLGEVYGKMGKYKTAIDTLRSALTEAESIGARKLMADIYKALAPNYDSIGDLRSSYAMFKAYDQYRDSLLNEKNIEQMTGMETEYEIQRQQKQIARLKDQDRVNRVRLIFGGLGAGVVFLGVILWLVFIRYRTQTRTTELLSRQKEEIQRRNDQLSSTNAELAQFADAAANDLRQPMDQIRSQLDRFSELELPKEAAPILRDMREQMQKSETLMAGLNIYSAVGMQEEAFEETDLTEAVSVALSQLPEDLRRHPVRISMQDMPVIRVIRGQVIQLFEQLLSNAIRFRGENDPEIRISSESKGDFYQFAVKDNGRGIPSEQQGRLFRIFSRLGEEGDAGAGIGLAISRKIVERHGGKIWVQSTPGAGSTFYFTLPGKSI